MNLLTFDSCNLVWFEDEQPAGVRVKKNDSHGRFALINQHVGFAINVDPCTADSLDGERAERDLSKPLIDDLGIHSNVCTTAVARTQFRCVSMLVA